MKVNVIGAGLAGCEAAWQIAIRGIEVNLYEMKPNKKSPAHHSEYFAELVCSNSLRSDDLTNAVGLLKEEMRILNSIIMECADKNRVPAGGALAVDRDGFSEEVTNKIRNNKNINIINKEVTSFDDIEDCEYNIIATGPLTSDDFSKFLNSVIDKDYLYFHDAAAPIVHYESIDMNKAFKAARYGKGSDDYINCPMTKEEYLNFYNELINAQVVPLKEFETEVVFEGCMPVEIMAKRGVDTLRFGPLKPVGIIDPKTNCEPYANIQLRQDNKEGTLFNIVGFQTHLKWGEQQRVFRLITGLENVEFMRYGVMHRNTFINSPVLLDGTYKLKKEINDKKIYFAGQITGVEGYLESSASGFISGLSLANEILGKEKIVFPQETAIGALAIYISEFNGKNFQPMNVNFGIIKSLPKKIKNKRERYLETSNCALRIIKEISHKCNI